jgi:RNA polymerase sigma-70 factor (ECF subfamily)
MDSPTAAIRLSAHASSADGASRPAELTDDQLIAAIRDEDSSEALGVLFKRYAHLVFFVAHRILRNHEEAEDLVTEVFLLIRKKASVFDSSRGTARSLIVMMTYQRAFTRRRYLNARHCQAPSEAAERAANAIAPAVPLYDQSIEARFGRERLRRTLDEMSEDQRETLRLYFSEGYTLGEIAAKLGQSAGNVRHHYYRSIAKLREALGIGKLKIR